MERRIPSLPIIRRIKDVVLEEMLHLGIACNLLNALDGGMPNISGSVPTYPRWGLPGGVHPGLACGSALFSKAVVADTFMKIEEPESGPIVWYRGESFPTIGASILRSKTPSTPCNLISQPPVTRPQQPCHGHSPRPAKVLPRAPSRSTIKMCCIQVTQMGRMGHHLTRPVAANSIPRMTQAIPRTGF